MPSAATDATPPFCRSNTDGMKILISAFALAPNVGSEGGVSWHWASELAKNNQVTIITDASRRLLIEETCISPPKNVTIIYFRPYWLRGITLNSSTSQLLYTAWQFFLFPCAHRLHRRHHFDLAIHLSYSVFRHPCFLGYLGIPFVFGPLGGGEDAPWSLKKSIRGREKLKELLRFIANKTALFDPFLWLAYARATLILTSTEQTRRALPWPFRKRAVVYPNLGIDTRPDQKPNARLQNEPLRVLFAGRLVGWKGVHLAILAIAQAKRKGTNVELSIIGKGPFESELKTICATTGVVDSIRWLGYRSQAELFAIYCSMHGFIFPSLHDSGGTVILEAQSFGLPIICLDIGGPATLVTPETAFIVGTHGRNEAEVVDQLADAVQELAASETKRIEMGWAAIVHASKNMSWSSRVEGLMALVRGTVRGT